MDKCHEVCKPRNITEPPKGWGGSKCSDVVILEIKKTPQKYICTYIIKYNFNIFCYIFIYAHAYIHVYSIYLHIYTYSIIPFL